MRTEWLLAVLLFGVVTAWAQDVPTVEIPVVETL